MKQSSSFNDGALLFGERKLTIVDCDFFVEDGFVALILFTVRPFLPFYRGDLQSLSSVLYNCVC